MKAKEILKSVGTLAIVGAASIAGAALWTNVLEYKYESWKFRSSIPTSDKVIDITEVRRRMSR